MLSNNSRVMKVIATCPRIAFKRSTCHSYTGLHRNRQGRRRHNALIVFTTCRFRLNSRWIQNSWGTKQRISTNKKRRLLTVTFLKHFEF